LAECAIVGLGCVTGYGWGREVLIGLGGYNAALLIAHPKEMHT
jgi:hypothetical protein